MSPFRLYPAGPARRDSLCLPPVLAGFLLGLLSALKMDVSPKRRVLSELHGVTTRNTVLVV
jgi:hypothetical protein